jgi:hypothetical protein
MEHADLEDFELVVLPSLREILEDSAAPDDEWLWCIQCERFFQAKHLRIDHLGNRQGCAFCDCAGFDCAVFPWDAFKDESGGEVWPDSVKELAHGLSLATLNQGVRDP